MEGEDEDNVKMLMDMGFPDEEEVRAALRMAKNEISEAVTFLTDENFKMNNAYSSDSRALAISGPSNYADEGQSVQDSATATELNDDNSLVFPYDELLELERRVSKDQWSIPYKPRESLGRCLVASARLAKEGLCDADDHCRRFTSRVMMESFTKLLTSSAVYSWSLEIHQGICSMLELFVDLLVARLPHPPVPCAWLTQILAQAFDPETDWNQKNKSKHASIRSGANTEDYACTFNLKGGTYGWLADLINYFGCQGGFLRIQECFLRESLSLEERAALLAPLGRAAELLVGERVKPLLSSAVEDTVNLLVSLDENKLSGKDARAVLDLLETMKRLFCYLWTEKDDKLTHLQLSILVRMLKTPNFSTRMNALQEISVIIEGTRRPARHLLAAAEVQGWMSEQGVLSLALEGNIDQKQYTDRIKAIIEFLGPHLSAEDLSKIWSMQSRHDIQVMENIHCMMSAAAGSFSNSQMLHLITLIERSWVGSKPWQQEGLLQLVGRMGRERRDPASVAQMLELLWRMAHAVGLSSRLVQMAMELHTEVLAESTDDQQVKLYISKCVEDISNGRWIVPALRHIDNIVDKIIHGTKNYTQIDKSALNQLMYVELEMPRLITGSLRSCHQRGVAVAAGRLQRHLVVDGDYKHGECLSTHLEVLQHLLKDTRLPLEWERVEDIWAALIDNPDSCADDAEICFDWFANCVGDLGRETQTRFFEEKLLQVEPTALTAPALSCFKTYFERVNLDKAVFRRGTGSLVVGSQSPVGVEYLWRILTEVADEDIAHAVIDQLLDIYYLNLETRLKRDPASQHNKFFNECYSRLESRRAALCDGVQDVPMTPVTPESPGSSPSKTASRRQSSDGPAAPCCPQLRGVRRLLALVRAYVERIEALYTEPRSIPPHGATFRGAPLQVHISHEASELTIQAHANESVQSLRQRAAAQLQLAPSNVQLLLGDKELDTPHQLLHRAGVTSCNCRLTVRSLGTATARARNGPELESESATVPEGGAAAPAAAAFAAPSDVSSERSLPGVVMAAGGAFSTLCSMAELRHTAVTASACDLLHLMPTEPEVSDLLETLCEPAGRQVAAEAPADKVRQLLGVSSGEHPATSGLRLLYNLEVLSGKLMPCRPDAGSAESARSFCRAFLEHGGLAEVLAALRREPAAGTDQGLVQQQTLLTLQIARFLLCERPEPSSVLLSSPGARPTPAKKSALDATATVAGTVHGLSASELHDTVACLLRLSSAAAAGRLGRDKRSQVEFFLVDQRRRQSSTGSATSSASEGEPGAGQSTCGGRPLLQHTEVLVATLALQLMVSLLQNRPHALGHVYSLPGVREHVVEMLLNSPSAEVRTSVADQMLLVSQIVTPQGLPCPRDFLTQVVLHTRVPLWAPSGSSRAGSQRLKVQSEQYFRLRAQLLTGLSAADQARLCVSASSMAEDEVGWLHNFSPAIGHDAVADDALLAGHLDLARALVTCHGVDRRDLGRTLISTLMDDFLFPASRRQGADGSPVSLPRCTGKASRAAAYRLFVEMCRDCSGNLDTICSQLVERHHAFDGELSKEFDYAPPLESRAACDYVGLKNAGATCYMNSVLQQLYLVPGLREAILGVQDEQVTEESVLCQLQMVFGHLLELKLQYFSPERFWTVFRLRGQPINVREQQDAYEFFTNLLDQTDEQLRGIEREPVFQQVFEGTFSDQKICQDCPHRYEREETFNALNLAIKSGTLQESLQQFVREEILDGDNSYFCDKCGKKRDAVKRTLIKSLPPVLVIQLKRFGYDWLAGHSIKFDGHFQFPFTLDMGPYTEEGTPSTTAAPAAGGDSRRQRLSTPVPSPALYELVGVVVHSGQASAGHYYSYAKDRRGSSLSNPNKGQWYKFNDITVEPVNMTEELLEQECFGGNYKVKVSDTTKPKWGPSEALPETRLRYWNGYMLFYEQSNDRLKTPRTPRKSTSASRLSRSHSRPLSRRNEDSLCQLTELVQQGDASDLFPDRMPSAIQQVVRDTNLKFMQNREVYSDEYFNFIYELVTCNMACGSAALAVPATRLAVHFLLHTYLHARRRCGTQTQQWLKTLRLLTESEPAAADWLLMFLSSDDGQRNFRPFLLVCDSAVVRLEFTQLIMIGLRAHFHHRGTVTAVSVQTLLGCLVEKHFPDSIRSCSQYMSLLSEYAHMGEEQCGHLLSLGVLPRLTAFLLGPPGSAGRWTVSQARQLGQLHTLLSLLLLSRLPQTLPELLYGERCEDYLREVLTTLREPGWQPQHTVRLLVRASRDQTEFSRRLTTALMKSFGSTPCDELRHLSQTLNELLALEDDCQQQRLDLVLDGGGDVEGMLGLIRKTSGANSRRAYQCIKFLVGTAARCEPLKRRLLAGPQRWLWAISWLREQMSEQAEMWEQPDSSAAAASAASNDDSSGRTFRRTTSAQMTLDECSRLFTAEDAEMELVTAGDDSP